MRWFCAGDSYIVALDEKQPVFSWHISEFWKIDAYLEKVILEKDVNREKNSSQLTDF